MPRNYPALTIKLRCKESVLKPLKYSEDFEGEAEDYQNRSQGDALEREYIIAECLWCCGCAASHKHKAEDDYNRADEQ